MKSLESKIRLLRESKNLSQEEVASRLGISLEAYEKIESCEAVWGMETVELLNKVLESGSGQPYSFDQKFLFNFFNTASGCGNISSHQIQHNYHLSGNEKKFYTEKIDLYEDQIKLLREMNNYLKAETERQKAEIEKLRENKG